MNSIDEEGRDSVAHLSTVDMVQRSFGPEDRPMFAFIFQPVKGTDHEFYRDVLHPSIHGVALHIALRVRDQASKRTWVAKRIDDKRLLKLIRAFLNAGVMENGLLSPSVEGVGR
jgi:hypothetical protein